VPVDVGEAERAVVGEAQRGRHPRHERAATSEHDQQRVVAQQRLEPVSDPAARLDDGLVAEQAARLVAIGSDDADGQIAGVPRTEGVDDAELAQCRRRDLFPS
jgi:hypothetical protein